MQIREMGRVKEERLLFLIRGGGGAAFTPFFGTSSLQERKKKRSRIVTIGVRVKQFYLLCEINTDIALQSFKTLSSKHDPIDPFKSFPAPLPPSGPPPPSQGLPRSATARRGRPAKRAPRCPLLGGGPEARAS